MLDLRAWPYIFTLNFLGHFRLRIAPLASTCPHSISPSTKNWWLHPWKRMLFNLKSNSEFSATFYWIFCESCVSDCYHILRSGFHSNPKERQCQRMLKLLHNWTHLTCFKVMLKILQARLQQYMNHELPDVQAGFRKGRGTRDQATNIRWIIKKAREFQKNNLFLLYWLMPKALFGSQ